MGRSGHRRAALLTCHIWRYPRQVRSKFKVDHLCITMIYVLCFPDSNLEYPKSFSTPKSNGPKQIQPLGPIFVKADPEELNRIQMLDPPFGGSCGPLFETLLLREYSGQCYRGRFRTKSSSAGWSSTAGVGPNMLPPTEI